MAAPQRPVPVTIIAVLNFVFGILGLLGSLCGGGIFLFGVIMMDTLAKQPGQPGKPNPFQGLPPIGEGIPGFLPFMVSSLVLGCVMALCLIIAGIGLLKMKGWGRSLSMFYAFVTILTTLVSTSYTIAYVNPGMEKWNTEFQQKLQANMKQGGGPPPANPMGQGGNAALSIAGAVFGIAYAVAILVVLNLPDVRRAFARAAGKIVDEPALGDEFDAGPRFGRPRSEDDRIQRPDEGYKP